MENQPVYRKFWYKEKANLKKQNKTKKQTIWADYFLVHNLRWMHQKFQQKRSVKRVNIKIRQIFLVHIIFKVYSIDRCIYFIYLFIQLLSFSMVMEWIKFLMGKIEHIISISNKTRFTWLDHVNQMVTFYLSPLFLFLGISFLGIFFWG